MRLIKCPQCDHVIDVDDIDLEELDKNDVIGCGRKEGDFLPCESCPCENDPGGCEDIRKTQKLTQTLVGEFYDN